MNEKDMSAAARCTKAMRWTLAASVAALVPAAAPGPTARAAAPSAAAVVPNAGDASPEALTREAVAAASDIKNPQQRAQCLLRIADPLAEAGQPAGPHPFPTPAPGTT